MTATICLMDHGNPDPIMIKAFPDMNAAYSYAYERWMDYLEERTLHPRLPDGCHVESFRNGPPPSWYVATAPRYYYDDLPF